MIKMWSILHVLNRQWAATCLKKVSPSNDSLKNANNILCITVTCPGGGMNDKEEEHNLCDLDAFIKKVDSKGTAVEMTHLDFYLFENGVSSGKFTYRPLLSSVCSV